MESQIWIDVAPHGLEQAHKAVFSKGALEFLAKVIRKFEARLESLLLQRQRTAIEIEEKLWRPRFNNPYENVDWKIAELPKRLRNRKIDLGDVSPANTVYFTDALYTNAQGIQVDFDDGSCPTWRNTVKGHANIVMLLNSQLPGAPENLTECPILMLRPRAFNMIEHKCMIDGKEVNGALFDFSLLIYHVGRRLYEMGMGPYFYLSKIEDAEETKLWNDIFLFVQEELEIPRGTIKACVLIENILASFCMDTILYNIREHAIGLNCGIWDYVASIISKFGSYENMIFPDRKKYINLQQPLVYKYMKLLISTCHKRDALATAGMAAHLLTNNSFKEIMETVTKAKSVEISFGFDGFLTYDFRTVPDLQALWNDCCPGDNQLKVLPDISDISAPCLIEIPKGVILMESIRQNLNVALLFIYHWLSGSGVFHYNGMVEDSATAEISRSQLWQWIRHSGRVNDSPNSIVTRKIIINELDAIVQYNFKTICQSVPDRKRMLSSKYLLIEMLTAKYPITYITTFLNDNHKFRALHNKNDSNIKAKL